MSQNTAWEIRAGVCFGEKELLGLYQSIGWNAYANRMEQLMLSIENSQVLFTAWCEDRCVGLIRGVTDHFSIFVIQDVLVHGGYQGKGIGRGLVRHAMESLPCVKQTMLLTEDKEANRGFYESLGFNSCDQGAVVAFLHYEP